MPKIEIRNSKIAEPIGIQPTRVRDFMDLEVWRLARELRTQIYSLVRKFPVEERYVVTAQIRRAAVSITANIAEGFGRYSYQ
jgi:23S rRNA-intervening sequence protein